MAEDTGATGRQASYEIPGAWLLNRGCSIWFWLSALAVVLTLFVGEMRVSWWIAVPIVVCFASLMALTGFGLWESAGPGVGTSEFTRLRRNGRPAVAEVLWLSRTRGRYGEPDTILLRLRVSGPDVPPFTAFCRGASLANLRVGSRVDAVVDPADNLFTLETASVRKRPRRRPPR